MTVKTAVIGHPIGHSKSPVIHKYWIDKHGLDGTYEALDIPCETLKNGIQNLVDEGYAGFNVTLPHKTAIMEYCDEIDDIATAIGAVNTVTIKDGKLHGTNTDAFGFLENIKQNARNFDFKAGKAVIIGAGGAAKAVLHALLEEGVQNIVITNRTPEKANALLAQNPYGIKVIPWDERGTAVVKANLVVNTTSLGMSGQPPLEIDLGGINDDALVTDIVYTPLETDFLKQAKDAGLQTVTGIGMLLHQARPGFELWHGILPDVSEELETKVLI